MTEFQAERMQQLLDVYVKECCCDYNDLDSEDILALMHEAYKLGWQDGH